MKRHMKSLGLLAITLFISTAQASSLTITNLCLDYLKVSKSSDSYKGNEDILKECRKIKKVLDQNAVLQNKIMEYLTSNSSIAIHAKNERKNYDSSIVDLSSIECDSSYDGESSCVVNVNNTVDTCELDFTRIEFRFDEEASNVKAIYGFLSPSCVSW